MESHLLLDVSKEQLFDMAGLVENALHSSLTALFDSKPLLAREVIASDKAVNSYEIDIDNATFNLLAIAAAAPNGAVPGMLRTIVAIQKINAMLERIGDHAVNIAESAISLVCESKDMELFNLPIMADLCEKILHSGIDSFFGNNLDEAEEVLTRDDVIDDLNMRIAASVKEKVQSQMMSFETAMEIIRICKNLERIADLSTNIAEETSFALAGRNIKHHNDQKASADQLGKDSTIGESDDAQGNRRAA
jgi:phosphate transport system protein